MAKDQQINSWDGGMNKDVSPHKMPPNMYFELKEGEVITSKEGNSYAVSPVQGNKLGLVIPRIPKTFTLNQIEQEACVFSFLFEDSNGILQGGVLVLPPDESLEFLYLQMLANPFIIAGLADDSLTIQYSSEYNSIYITFNNENVLNSITLQTGSTVIINSQIPHSPIIVGGGDFNDDFVIFTTSEDTWGQIWLAIYDETTTSITDLQLKYNGPLELSKDKPIRRIQSVIEDPDEYGTIYWTDAFNPIRVLNLYDDDSLNIPIGQIDLQVGSDYGHLQIDRILSTGIIRSGSTIQFTYRLVSSSGAKTPYAPLTQLLPLADDNPYEYSESYGGTSQTPETLSNKAVSLILSGLDTEFSRLDIAAIVYPYQGTPDVLVETDINIPSNGILNYTFTGTDAVNEDILSISSIPDRIRTANDLVVKDNRLIALGITTEKSELDYDARAFSFRYTDGQWKTSIYNNINLGEAADLSTFNYSTLLSDLDSFPESNSDCVNPSWITKKENFLSPPDEASVNFSSADGLQAWNPAFNALGGWGKNVNFYLINTTLIGYKDDNINSFVPNDGNGLDPGTLDGTFQFHENEIVDFTGEIANYKSPKVATYFKGYKRGETYRFGIKFFDKNGSPYPVKWIADYRIPEDYNPNTQFIPGFTMFENVLPMRRIGDVGGSLSDGLLCRFFNGALELYPIGVEFNIENLETIRDKISGFTIVRAQRNQEDKSVLGNGYLTSTIEQDDDIFMSPGIGYKAGRNLVANTSGSNNSLKYPVFTTPELNYNNKLFTKSDGDYLSTHYHKYASRREESLADLAGVYNAQYFIVNEPESRIPYNEIIDIDDSDYMSTSDQNVFIDTKTFNQSKSFFTVDSAYIYGNTFLSPADLDPISYWATNAKMGLALNSDIDDSGINYGNIVDEIYPLTYADYCRDIYDQQYSGNSYFNRENFTTYIDASTFVSYKPINARVSVFGGDTYINMWDHLNGAYTFWYGVYKAQFIIPIVPIESSYNLAFRSEARILYNLPENIVVPAGGLSPGYLTRFDDENRFGLTPNQFRDLESYDYNGAYDQKNIINQSIGDSTITKATNNLPSSIWASEPKILGEVVDSWRIFLPNNLYDLDAIYGPINRAEILNNNIVTIQDEAVALVPINERVMINDETSTALTLGTGDVIGKHKYITTTSGSKQPFSVVQSDKGIYYFDTRNKKLNRINQGKEPISVMKGMDSYFRNAVSDSLIINEFNPLNNVGIVSEINRETDRVYISLLGINKGASNDGETVVFNERNDNFIYLSRHAPRLYISNSSTILTPNPVDITSSYDALTSAWIEGQGDYSSYYGNIDLDNPYKTELSFYVNKHSPLSKTFNNINFDLQGNDNITKIDVSTYDQASNNNTNITKRFRTYRHTIGRNGDTKERMSGPWALVTLTANNTLREYFALYDVITYIDVYNLNAQ
jgi:hypothetical protein